MRKVKVIYCTIWCCYWLDRERASPTALLIAIWMFQACVPMSNTDRETGRMLHSASALDLACCWVICMLGNLAGYEHKSFMYVVYFVGEYKQKERWLFLMTQLGTVRIWTLFLFRPPISYHSQLNLICHFLLSIMHFLPIWFLQRGWDLHALLGPRRLLISHLLRPGWSLKSDGARRCGSLWNRTAHRDGPCAKHPRPQCYCGLVRPERSGEQQGDRAVLCFK